MAAKPQIKPTRATRRVLLVLLVASAPAPVYTIMRTAGTGSAGVYLALGRMEPRRAVPPAGTAERPGCAGTEPHDQHHQQRSGKPVTAAEQYAAQRRGMARLSRAALAVTGADLTEAQRRALVLRAANPAASWTQLARAGGDGWTKESLAGLYRRGVRAAGLEPGHA